MGIVDNIKRDAKKAGSSKGKFFFVREGEKRRIRFLTDMDDGMEVPFHDSYEAGINVPCQEVLGRDCPYCEEEGLRTRSQYIWSVYDYETKQVLLFMYPVNNCSPVPQLMAMYENYGTLCDRDYVIQVQGKQQNKTFTVIPQDKEKFRNTKAKAYSEKAILKMIDKAYPADDVDDDDDDYEEEQPKKKPASKGAAGKKPSNKKKQPDQDDEDEDDEYEDDWDEDEEDDEIDYSDMTPQELYKECKKRKIDVAPKKPAKYYIKQLEEYDAAQDDWDDEDDDEWEEDDDE